VSRIFRNARRIISRREAEAGIEKNETAKDDIGVIIEERRGISDENA